MAVHVAEGLAFEGDAALLRRVHAVDAIQHGAFARAIGSDDGANLMLAHVKRNVGQRLDTTKGEADVMNVEDDVAYFFTHAAAFTGA